MKSATGFRVRRRLSLRHIIRARFGHDPHQTRAGLGAETTGFRDLAADGRIKSADMRIFDDRERAAERLSGAVDCVRLRRITVLAGAALLALCLAAPAAAAPIDKEPEPLDRNTAPSWTLIVGDPEEAPQPGTSQHPALADQPLQIMPMPSLPPPGDVLDAVGVLRLSCPKWQAGQTPGYETEAHVCQLLAGHDTSYNEGEVAGSRVAVALLASLWLFRRSAQWVSAPLDRLWKRIGSGRAGMP